MPGRSSKLPLPDAWVATVCSGAAVSGSRGKRMINDAHVIRGVRE
jgi:hypothetical protein